MCTTIADPILVVATLDLPPTSDLVIPTLVELYFYIYVAIATWLISYFLHYAAYVLCFVHI